MISTVIKDAADSLIAFSDDYANTKQVLPQNLQDAYTSFLSLCNGGYSKDYFFHFFGNTDDPANNVNAWNARELWKKYYCLDDTSFVFAEDIFGTQFFFDTRGNRRVVKMLVPDGGRASLCANTFEEFLRDEVLSKQYNDELRRFASDFLRTIPEWPRLCCHITCKVPTSLGGSYRDVSNLQLISSRTNMRVLGQLTIQLKRFAPGTRIRDVRIDYEREHVTLIPAND